MKLKTSFSKNLVRLMIMVFTSQVTAISSFATDDLTSEVPTGPRLDKQVSARMGPTEFVFQPYPGAVLMPVNLWGSVQRAGIYRVPLNTDLVTLMSLAGGPSESADMETITIRRQMGDRAGVMSIDGEALLKKKNFRPPILEANDIVYIPKTMPLISNNTMLAITVVASLLSIVVSGLVINSELKK